jgi:hypothetical protein
MQPSRAEKSMANILGLSQEAKLSLYWHVEERCSSNNFSLVFNRLERLSRTGPRHQMLSSIIMDRLKAKWHRLHSKLILPLTVLTSWQLKACAFGATQVPLITQELQAVSDVGQISNRKELW